MMAFTEFETVLLEHGIIPKPVHKFNFTMYESWDRCCQALFDSWELDASLGFAAIRHALGIEMYEFSFFFLIYSDIVT